MSKLVPIKGGSVPAPQLPAVPSTRMVAVLAADLPPALPDGMTLVKWLDATQNFVGSHPEAVLVEARDAILSTFVFSPKKAEIISHILDAYQRLGIPLSEDAKKHLSFRKKMPDRYTLNSDGVKRFADDAKVTLIGYFSVQGPQMNIILDRLNRAGVSAIVEDVEASIRAVTDKFSSNDKVSGSEVLAAFEKAIRLRAHYRLHGEPADHCGGPVAMAVSASSWVPVPLSSDYLAISEAFASRMRERYPHARCRDNPRSWTDALKEAFWSVAVSRNLDLSHYGSTLQAEAEQLIERKLAELNRDGRAEQVRRLKIDRRLIASTAALIEATAAQLRRGEVTATRIDIDNELMIINNTDDLAAAERKLDTYETKVEASIRDLGSDFE